MMARFETTDKVALIIAVLLIVGGFFALLLPQDFTFGRATNFPRAHRVSLATGGWRDSARLKMASAGMCFDDYPAASADDAFDRESIMRLSKQRAAERYGESFACTVYVGDGVWDARACRSVGIPFIGIGTRSRATRLSAEGAVCVFPDFSDADIFLKSVYEIANAARMDGLVLHHY